MHSSLHHPTQLCLMSQQGSQLQGLLLCWVTAVRIHLPLITWHLFHLPSTLRPYILVSIYGVLKKPYFCARWASDFMLQGTDSPPYSSSSTSCCFVSSDCGTLMLAASLLAHTEVVPVQLNSWWLVLQVSIPGLKKPNTLVEGLFIKSWECCFKDLHQASDSSSRPSQVAHHQI